jgi:dolichol-phosphate mannosyltransferase
LGYNSREVELVDRNKIRLAVVTPMANEGADAVEFVRQVLAQCGGFQRVEHFIVLDKVSKDDTQEILNEYARTERRLTVVWAPENRCVVDAYVQGYREALKSGADWVLEIDAGFSHQPSDIPPFFDEMEKGYDCVFATRFGKGGKVENSSLKREIVSKGGTILTNLLLGTKLSDMTSGFQLFRAEVLEKILEKGLFSRGPFFQTEMKAYCSKLNFVELPITYRAASHSIGSSAVKESFTQLQRLRELKRTGQLYIEAVSSRISAMK